MKDHNSQQDQILAQTIDHIGQTKAIIHITGATDIHNMLNINEYNGNISEHLLTTCIYGGLTIKHNYCEVYLKRQLRLSIHQT